MRDSRARPAAWAALLVGAAIALAFGACGSSDDSESGDSGSGDSGADVRVGLAQPTSRSDDSFGKLSHEGATRAERDFGVKLTEVDSLGTPQKQLTALQSLARSNDLILMAASISEQGVHKQYPDTDFVVTAGAMPAAPNTHSTITDWYPISYLAGVAAAQTSRSGAIGFVGGVPVTVVREAAKGYELGAKSVDPSIKVLVTNTGSFTDSAKGKSAAAAQISDGADVIYADLDSAHRGVVQAAEAGDAKVIGSVAPKCELSSGLDIGDTLIRQDRIVYQLVERFAKDGDLPSKITFGLDDGVAEFVLCSSASPAVRSAVQKARRDILDGKVRLPAPAGS